MPLVTALVNRGGICISLPPRSAARRPRQAAALRAARAAHVLPWSYRNSYRHGERGLFQMAALRENT